MKHLKMFMAGFLALSMGLTACSSEELEDPTTTTPGNEATEGSKDGVYSSIRFHLPASRSEAKEGEEVGKDYENSIGSILVVLATENGGTYNYLTYALSDASVSTKDGATHTVVFQEKEKLVALANQKIYVFAYCNPTEEIRSFFTSNTTDKTNFVDAICNQNVTTTWSNDGFLMTNVSLLSKDLPSEDKIKECSTEATALPLGIVEVIRTAVRFDYKDGSPKQEGTETDADGDKVLTPKFGTNIYPIYDASKQNPTDKDIVAKVHMTNVALFNMRNDFYYLPRTNAAGLCPTMTGMETLNTGDYVITPGKDASYSLGIPMAIRHGDAAYNALEWDSLDNIVKGKADNDEGWGAAFTKADKQGYYIWRYTTENTTNGFVVDNDNRLDKSTITGAIFEAEIIFNEGKAPAEGQPAYLFGNTIYPDIESIQADIKNAPISNLATAYKEAFIVNADNTVSPKSDEEVEKAGFTIYKPSADGKYYCYYWYYNRHNNNGDPAATGIMEFATVRNNVYKLSVTGVKKLGTFKPDEEVEDWDAYFSLDVDVKPWVVRVNNIEF